MPALQGNCAVELKLDQCLSAAAEKAGGQAPSRAAARAPQALARPQGARIPSWFHLPSHTGAAGSLPTPTDAASNGIASGTSPAAAVSRARTEDRGAPVATKAPRASHRSGSAPPVAPPRSQAASAPAAPTASESKTACADTRETASAPSSPNGLKVVSASSSSGDALAEQAGARHSSDSCAARDAVAMLREGVNAGAPAGAAGAANEAQRQSSAGSSAASTPGTYGARPEGRAWRGLLPLAQTLELASTMGSRQRSSFALDVIAP